jgi:hypothetical protein
MEQTVHLLWYVRRQEGRDDTELLIGVYDSEAAATEAIGRLKSRPGFIEFPEGFKIYPRTIGQDSWTDGFILD